MDDHLPLSVHEPLPHHLYSSQAYDFESGLCIFNGMHANAGFLPVVPGEKDSRERTLYAYR